MFSLYSIIAIAEHQEESEIDSIFLPSHILLIVESTIQSGFLINAMKMYSPDKQMRKTKPGRSLITMLVFLNLCLWGLDTFNAKKYDMSHTQLDYYNVVFWSMVSSISTPLSIFFRFHSSVCFSEIWSSLYEESRGESHSEEKSTEQSAVQIL